MRYEQIASRGEGGMLGADVEAVSASAERISTEITVGEPPQAGDIKYFAGMLDDAGCVALPRP